MNELCNDLASWLFCRLFVYLLIYLSLWMSQVCRLLDIRKEHHMSWSWSSNLLWACLTWLQVTELRPSLRAHILLIIGQLRSAPRFQQVIQTLMPKHKGHQSYCHLIASHHLLGPVSKHLKFIALIIQRKIVSTLLKHVLESQL